MPGHQLKPLEIEPISKRTYETISKAIIRGTLEPGSTLSDRKLADQLGVSRTPVREALHLLESSGLVARRERVGWVVTRFGESEVRELYQLRRLFEPAGFATLPEWSEALTLELHDLVDQTRPQGRGDLDRVVEADRRFHRKLVETSRNRRLIEFYDVVSAQIDRIRYFVPTHDRNRLLRSHLEHERIVAAVDGGDPVAARQALEDHMIAAEKAMLSLM